MIGTPSSISFLTSEFPKQLEHGESVPYADTVHRKSSGENVKLYSISSKITMNKKCSLVLTHTLEASKKKKKKKNNHFGLILSLAKQKPTGDMPRLDHLHFWIFFPE